MIRRMTIMNLGEDIHTMRVLGMHYNNLKVIQYVSKVNSPVYSSPVIPMAWLGAYESPQKKTDNITQT